MKFTRLVALAAAMAFAAPHAVRAQVSIGTVTGVVRSQGAPVEGAAVTVQGTTLGALTRTDGRYSIANVPAGAHTMRVMRLGFTMQEQRVTVTAGQTAPPDFEPPTRPGRPDQLGVAGSGTPSRREATASAARV